MHARFVKFLTKVQPVYSRVTTMVITGSSLESVWPIQSVFLPHNLGFIWLRRGIWIFSLVLYLHVVSHLSTSTLLLCGLKSNQIYLDPKSQCLPRRTFHPAQFIKRKPFLSFWYLSWFWCHLWTKAVVLSAFQVCPKTLQPAHKKW